MSYEIIATSNFEKNLKNLAKKYPSIKNDISKLCIKISQNPETGIKLFENTYKIRMSIYSKGKGKSGGARVITLRY